MQCPMCNCAYPEEVPEVCKRCGFPLQANKLAGRYEKVETGRKCPECGGSSVIPVEGCEKCMTCGWSACGN